MLDLLLSQLVFFPAALLCFLPMKNKLRFTRLKTALIVGLSLSAAIPFFSWLGYRFDLIKNTSEDVLMLILFPLFFAAYLLCVKAPVRQSLTVFFAVVSLLSILTRITSRLYHVMTGSYPVGTRYEIVLITICILTAILLTHMFLEYGSYLIDRLDVSSVWYATIVFSVTLFVFSMLLKPILEDPTTGKTSRIYALLSQIVLLLFWLAMVAMFYFAVKGLLKRKHLEAENRMLAMREHQFESQQRYIKASERTRHDFRQNVRTMRELYDAGDMDALGRYLHAYEQTIPIGDIKYFTENHSLNAILNYYQHISRQNEIRFTVQIQLPALLTISDVDLCTVIGNILENAAMACMTTNDRFIDLTVLTENEAQLYIIETNSFDGKARRKDQQYLSTKRTGEAYGLDSIKTIAESYGGVANFSHEDNRFFSNIAIPLNHVPQHEET